ncbi:MAG: SRPBCC domain-containing protein [Spirochaetia bacterium]|nr:SRPBCC domain-containing protein [Spirochaetia bacterium]
MCKTIKHKVKFKAAPDAIYRILADSKNHSDCTGAKATISKEVGGAFTALSGDVAGINVDLAPGKRIVQAWRRKDFPVGIFSMATFNLNATRDGGTELVLTHRGVPKALIPDVEANWRKNYWSKMKEYLG